MPFSTGRRFLSLPAVVPCETVSPASLLDALISSANEICAFRSAQFRVPRSTARASIRLVHLLLPLLESLPESAACPACLEFHIAFQKLRLLLHDCSRDGTRLLLLFRSHDVAREFHAIHRGIATGLDALLLAQSRIGEEATEVVRLAARHAGRDRIAIDPSDERAVKIARSAFDRFGAGVRPDPEDIWKLLDHLGIRSWTDCNDEISFLEEEIRLSVSSGEDTATLWSLLGLALYSRSVCCEAPEPTGTATTCPGKMTPRVTAFDWLKPEEFRCPISLDLMTDPVTTSTGQTYNRSSILLWFKAGNLTCPVTGEKVPNTDLVPNIALRNLIHSYSSTKHLNVPNPHAHVNARSTGRSSEPSNATASGALRLLATFLVDKLSHGTENERRRAIYEVRLLLARSSVFNRSCLVNAGIVPCLLLVLSTCRPTMQEHAMSSLLNLSKHEDGPKAIAESGGIVPVVDALSNSATTAETKQDAAATLFYLSSTERYRVLIGETSGAIRSLVRLLKMGSPRGKRNAAAALNGLLPHMGNYTRVIAAGAIPILAGLVSPTEREEVVMDALAVLAVLAERGEGSDAILQTNAVTAMGEVLRWSTSQPAKERCVTIMLCLCDNGGPRAVGCLEGLPMLITALYSQLTEGSQRASKKASTLIGILHRSIEVRAVSAFPGRREGGALHVR